MDMDQLYDSLRDAIDNTKDSREEAKEHYKYYYGDQLSKGVMEILNARGQPVRWENEYRKIASKIEGYKIQQRQEVRVMARQVEEDRDISHILTDILRTIPDSTDFYDQKDAADLDLMLAGFCVLAPEIVIEPRRDRARKLRQ